MRAAIRIVLGLATLLTLSACKDEELERENSRLANELRDVRARLERERTTRENDRREADAERLGLREELDHLEGALADAMKRSEQEAARVHDAHAELDRFREENGEFQQKFDAMSQALQAATTACSELQEQAAAREEIVESLRGRLEESEVAAADTVRRENECEAERTRLANRLLEAEERTAVLEESLAEVTKQWEQARTEIEALRTLVPDPPGPIAGKSIDAKVTGVDVDLNVVLLSAGTDDGVAIGDEFTVYRGNEYVAKVVVDRVAADHCTAHSQKAVEKSPIRVGDSATTKF